MKEKSNVVFDFWACPRPLTGKWGSGQVYDRIQHPEKYPRMNSDLAKLLGGIDVAFGKTDGIPEGILAIDLNTGYDWKNLSMFKDNQFKKGYWDPPYDKMYKHEGMEIWRTCRKLAILHTFIWPRAWLKDSRRIGMVAVTMGPLKQIRCLQVFEKTELKASV